MKTLLNILKSQRTRSSLMIVCLISIALLFISAINKKSDSKVELIDVNVLIESEGKSMLTNEDIYNFILEDNNDLIGKLMVDVNTRKLEQRVVSHPNVDKAQIYYDAKNVLHCRVSEKVPVYRVINAHSGYYLSDNGDKFPLSSHYTARNIIVSGHVPTYDDSPSDENAKVISDLMMFYDEISRDEFSLSLIDHIYMKKNGDMIISPVLGNFEIHFGNVNKTKDKLKRLKTFYSEVMSKEDWNKYKYIDLRFSDQVIAKKK